ncbi:MAG: hypothetical protein U5K00_16770 [Melioribacteraceae bacterium]|nr:hypothetical protein [Melioribacteraceae bacterium]
MLLNAYGRGGMLAVRAGSDDTCQGCTGKDCIMACSRNKFDARSCPSLLNPPKLNSNKDCLVCGQCIKSCEPDNMQLLLRKPFSEKDTREQKASWSLTIFIMLVSGFVTYELSTEWAAANKMFLIIPDFLTDQLGLENAAGFIKGIWTIGIFPLLLWTLLGVLTVLTKGAKSIFDAWRELALPSVIIISAGHVIKAVAKLNTWAGYIPGSIKDTNGEETAKLISAGVNIPEAFISNLAVSIIGIFILVLAFIYSIREEKIIFNSYINSHFLPKLILFLLFSTIVMESVRLVLHWNLTEDLL